MGSFIGEPYQPNEHEGSLHLRVSGGPDNRVIVLRGVYPAYQVLLVMREVGLTMGAVEDCNATS